MHNDDRIVENWSIEDMIEIILREPDDFLKIKETLTRIGVSSQSEKSTLYQSCHILHKQGRYFIVHFKELFILDGNTHTLSVNDLKRRNTIAILLSDWGLCELVDSSKVSPQASLKQIKIISFNEKENWMLKSKYTIGNTSKT